MLTMLLTVVIFALALFGLSLGAVLGGRLLLKSCGGAEAGGCVCARPCPRRRAQAGASAPRGESR